MSDKTHRRFPYPMMFGSPFNDFGPFGGQYHQGILTAELFKKVFDFYKSKIGTTEDDKKLSEIRDGIRKDFLEKVHNCWNQTLMAELFKDKKYRHHITEVYPNNICSIIVKDGDEIVRVNAVNGIFEDYDVTLYKPTLYKPIGAGMSGTGVPSFFTAEITKEQYDEMTKIRDSRRETLRKLQNQVETVLRSISSIGELLNACPELKDVVADEDIVPSDVRSVIGELNDLVKPVDDILPQVKNVPPMPKCKAPRHEADVALSPRKP